MSGNPLQQRRGIYRDGRVELEEPVDWPAGSAVVVQPIEEAEGVVVPKGGLVIVAGFGLAGRCVADLLDHSEIEYVVIEKNAVTVETQGCLGRRILAGDVSDEVVLREADIGRASILALTVPDEDAVLAAVALARRLNPEIYIIARTNYTSAGMQASRLGADDVVKAEMAVALQFYERLRHRLGW